jgi:HEPN domain-containing protein
MTFALLNSGLPQNKAISGSPLDWLARAKGNLALAKQPKPEDAFWEDLCFQAQQAAEKAIKAVYQYKGLNFRFTHDLEELGKGLEDSGVLIPLAIKEAVILTQYASETRYPGPFEPVTEEEYHEAVRLSESVVRWAENIIRGKEYNSSQ